MSMGGGGSMPDMGPRTRGGQMGGMDQERLMQEAERERMVKETEEIHEEEAAERGEAPPAAKAPWWKFWAR
jgi:hypothetical protein